MSCSSHDADRAAKQKTRTAAPQNSLDENPADSPEEGLTGTPSPALVRDRCQELGFPFEPPTIASLTAYLALLAKWNKAMNLVGPPRWEDILSLLIVDSFHLARFLPALSLPPEPECWDLGAGAGLPGIPLRMIWKKGRYVLVEAREKRALFLRAALAACPLPEVTVFHGRAEQFMPGRAPADLVVSRAFLPWEKVLGLVSDFMAPGGYAVFLTRAPLPESLPSGWSAAAVTSYAVGRDIRYFWALRAA